MRYYKLPLSGEKIIKNEELEICTIEESISNFIHLILTTHFGEVNFDEYFGCDIWNIDFDNLINGNKLKYTIINSINKTITLNEKRLFNIDVSVMITQDEFRGQRSYNRVKKRIDIKIDATKKKTNENFSSKESFYIAPLAY